MKTIFKCPHDAGIFDKIALEVNTMNNLFKMADRYVEESDWKDMAMLKFCLCGMGMVIGSSLSPKHKREVIAVAVRCLP